MVTKKVSTPYCHQASYLGPHPPGRKGSKLRMLWHRCTNRLHILGDKIHSGPWNIIKLKSVFTLLFAGEALDIKARPPNLKLLCWRDTFTHVSPRKWASGIQRPSQMESNCLFAMQCTTNLWGFAFENRRAFVTYDVNWGLLLSPHKCR